MRERAANHSHQTDGMRDAIAVFDEWLASYNEPSPAERREQEREWEMFKSMCETSANRHAYAKSPSQHELKRARNDVMEGQRLLVELFSRRRQPNGQQSSSRGISFPITSFTAIFGGPGLHGYGKHTIESSECADNATTSSTRTLSCVDIYGIDGMTELIGEAKTVKLGLVKPAQIQIQYDHSDEIASVTVEQSQSAPKLTYLWNKAVAKKNDISYEKKAVEDNEDRDSVSWTCTSCTFLHTGESKSNYLLCELCGSERTEGPNSCPKRPDSRAATASTTSITRNNESNKNQSSLTAPPSSPWGCLRAPSQKDISGPRKRRKGLEEPPPMMDYIIVLDFEWTADNRRRMEPIAEITQFPSVALRLLEGRDDEQKLDEECSCSIPIPHDLRSPPQRPSRRDAWCISIFDSFVKPTLNPVLTQFSIELTAITQDMVDTAPTIDQVIVKYMRWLRGIGLVDNDGNRIGNWTFATWGDVDLMSTLRE